MFAHVSAMLTPFLASTRYTDLFSLSDRELSRRGYDRSTLARSYVLGLSHS